MAKQLSDNYLSVLMLELSLLLRAGVSVADGLRLLQEDEQEDESRQLLGQLAAHSEHGGTISAALTASGRFPDYLVHMVEVGERTGRLEDCCRALSEYYDNRQRLHSALRSALGYPLLLLALMLAVIVVLLVQVLPIFNDVFQQLGLSLGAAAAAMLSLGAFLSAAARGFAVVLALLLLAAAGLWFSPGLRDRCYRWYCDRRGSKGLTAELSSCRFASAMTMALASGLPNDEALELAASLAANSRAAEKRFAHCHDLLGQGESLAAALAHAHILSPIYGRMLLLGEKSGAADTVMAEISRRLDDSLNESISRVVGRVEPGLVLLTSLLVGGVLLAVMLPLMNIMSVLG